MKANTLRLGNVCENEIMLKHTEDNSGQSGKWAIVCHVGFMSS
jgi:hypothetical protein